MIDPTLRDGSTSEIMRCIHIGLLCVQENVADRPTMASVMLMLNSYSLSLPIPSHPAFFFVVTLTRTFLRGWSIIQGRLILIFPEVVVLLIINTYDLNNRWMMLHF